MKRTPKELFEHLEAIQDRTEKEEEFYRAFTILFGKIAILQHAVEKAVRTLALAAEVMK